MEKISQILAKMGGIVAVIVGFVVAILALAAIFNRRKQTKQGEPYVIVSDTVVRGALPHKQENDDTDPN